jgi:4-hydroxyphenylpyruvate dioxygenase
MATSVEEKTVTGFANPMGTDGFEFVEYTAPDIELLRSLFTKMGFPEVARHKSKNVTLHKQGDCNFVINAEPGSYAEEYANAHGPSACAMAFRVKDAKAAHERAISLGATNVEVRRATASSTSRRSRASADRACSSSTNMGANGSIYEVDFDFHPDWQQRMLEADSKLTYIDHLTHNVNRGNMATWADFYERLFNFREIRYFDIEGKVTGLFSKAMTSPCGKIRIPLNESQDDKSQIEEFLREYKGEGIQHIALGTTDIYSAVDVLRARGIPFQDTPDTYYELLPERIKGHDEDLEGLEKRRILMDGAPTEGQGLLLQIFTQNVIGPIFFEIIQRKGNEGFGEGNFKALFESIELDQMRRGVI